MPSKISRHEAQDDLKALRATAVANLAFLPHELLQIIIVQHCMDSVSTCVQLERVCKAFYKTINNIDTHKKPLTSSLAFAHNGWAQLIMNSGSLKLAQKINNNNNNSNNSSSNNNNSNNNNLSNDTTNSMTTNSDKPEQQQEQQQKQKMKEQQPKPITQYNEQTFNGEFQHLLTTYLKLFPSVYKLPHYKQIKCLAQHMLHSFYAISIVDAVDYYYEDQILLSRPFSRYSEAVKIVVMGTDGVGKSAFTLRYIEQKFISEYDPTIEDNFLKTIAVHSNKNKQQNNTQFCLRTEILDTCTDYNQYRMRDQFVRI